MKLSRRRLDDRSTDALLSGRAVAGEPELSAFAAQVQAMQTAAPIPSVELAAMLEHGIAPAVLDRTPYLLPAPARRAVSWRYAMISLSAAMAAVLGAGAANALPAPAQRAVADVVGWFTPLHLPQPSPDHDTPAVVPTSTPSAEPTDGSTGTHRPVPGVTRSPEHSGDGTGDGTDVRETPSGSDGTGSGSGGDGTGDSATPSPTASSDSGSGGSGGGSSDGGSNPTPTPSSTPDSSGSGSSSGSTSLSTSPDSPES